MIALDPGMVAAERIAYQFFLKAPNHGNHIAWLSCQHAIRNAILPDNMGATIVGWLFITYTVGRAGFLKVRVRDFGDLLPCSRPPSPSTLPHPPSPTSS